MGLKKTSSFKTHIFTVLVQFIILTPVFSATTITSKNVSHQKKKKKLFIEAEERKNSTVLLSLDVNEVKIAA